MAELRWFVPDFMTSALVPSWYDQGEVMRHDANFITVSSSYSSQVGMLPRSSP
jgi:hypothetical protein